MNSNQYTFEGSLEQLAGFATAASRRLGRRTRVLFVVVLLSPLIVSAGIVLLWVITAGVTPSP